MTSIFLSTFTLAALDVFVVVAGVVAAWDAVVAEAIVAIEEKPGRAPLLVDCTDAGPFELLATAALELVTSGVALALSAGAVVVATEETGPANFVQKPSAKSSFAVRRAQIFGWAAEPDE
jgi:hypothetical protein